MFTIHILRNLNKKGNKYNILRNPEQVVTVGVGVGVNQIILPDQFYL